MLQVELAVRVLPSVQSVFIADLLQTCPRSFLVQPKGLIEAQRQTRGRGNVVQEGAGTWVQGEGGACGWLQQLLQESMTNAATHTFAQQHDQLSMSSAATPSHGCWPSMAFKYAYSGALSRYFSAAMGLSASSRAAFSACSAEGWAGQCSSQTQRGKRGASCYAPGASLCCLTPELATVVGEAGTGSAQRVLALHPRPDAWAPRACPRTCLPVCVLHEAHRSSAQPTPEGPRRPAPPADRASWRPHSRNEPWGRGGPRGGRRGPRGTGEGAEPGCRCVVWDRLARTLGCDAVGGKRRFEQAWQAEQVQAGMARSEVSRFSWVAPLQDAPSSQRRLGPHCCTPPRTCSVHSRLMAASTAGSQVASSRAIRLRMSASIASRLQEIAAAEGHGGFAEQL